MVNEHTSTDPVVKQKPRSFRWRMIPATLLSFFAVFGFVAGIVSPLYAVCVNLQYGWIVENPSNRASKFVALTWANLTIWQLHFWIGVVAAVATLSWVRGRWYVAWSTTLLSYILMCISGYLQGV